MTRLQNIENALRNLNDVAFQELCDSFLALRNENYAAFARVGTMSGRQKSVWGTPDLLILLPNGKYIAVQHSTNISHGVAKIIDDIKKCLQSEKTSIPTEQILEIIICLNFNIKPAEIEQLRNLLTYTRIKLTIYSLDSLAIELHLHHRDLVHMYLGLPLDTGQIVSLDKFVEEYDKAAKSIATPLNNVFLHREEELTDLTKKISLADLIILTGPAGVGKTKLVLETIRQFLSNHLDYAAYCISYKSYHLLDDLYQYFDNNKNYILFVDDANRIDALNQVIGFYKASRIGTLKIIVTVRDYAYAEVERQFINFSPVRIDLKRMTDQEIVDIISSDSFSIKNKTYQDQIVRIADGNPRIAIMTALLAVAKQNLMALHDLSDLFDKYFETFIRDEKILNSRLSIQSLGLISFFYTIPFKERNLVNSILSDFGLTFYEFLDSIGHLERMELVDIQFEHVKIPEQNLALFFFYKAFFATDYLSIQILLEKYFESNINRFRECVIAATNTFGASKVINKLKPQLTNYWEKVKEDPKKVFAFMNAFAFYIPIEILQFIYSSVTEMKEPIDPVYETDFANNLLNNEKDKIVSILSLYFNHIDHFRDAIELALLYASRKPESLPELLHNIKENITFDWRDEQYDFSRQRQLFEVLTTSKQYSTSFYAAIFFDLSKIFLKFKFRHTELVRENTISWYHYPFPNRPSALHVRSNIWNELDQMFLLNPEKSLEILQDYASVQPDVITEIMAFDVSFVVTIINKHLSSQSFTHCKYVQDQLRWFKRNNVTEPSFSDLSMRFTNPIYNTYIKLDWNRLRDKDIFDFTDFKEYEKLKEADIRASFIFTEDNQIDVFYESFLFLKKTAKNDWNYNNTLSIIIDENSKLNINVAFAILQKVITAGNDIDYIPGPVLRQLLKKRNIAEDFWNTVNISTFKYSLQWKLAFFSFIDTEIIKKDDLPLLIATIRSINEKIALHFDGYIKYLKFDSELFEKLLGIVVEINENSTNKITAWADFFTSDITLFHNIELVKKAYLQQVKLETHFDFDSAAFIYILRLDTSFLLEYVKSIYEDKNYGEKDTNRPRNIIWQIESIEEQLEKVFNYVAEREYHWGILETYPNNFFQHLDEENIKRADSFLLTYVSKYYSSTQKINMVVDIVRHSRKVLFEQILLVYISLNQNVDDFSKIWWRGNGGVYSGDVIVGDLQAAEWREILEIVEKSSIGISLLSIKKYILDEIEASYTYADQERKRRFIERN